MKKFFKQRGKKLTAVATAFALLCTAGVLPENVRHASAAEETGSSQAEDQVPEEDQTSGEGLALTRENFPDRVFRSYLQGSWKECDKDGDGKLSDKELHSLTIFETNVDQNDDSSPKIKSLRGIEKLKYLEEVKVYGRTQYRRRRFDKRTQGNRSRAERCASCHSRTRRRGKRRSRCASSCRSRNQIRYP